MAKFLNWRRGFFRLWALLSLSWASLASVVSWHETRQAFEYFFNATNSINTSPAGSPDNYAIYQGLLKIKPWEVYTIFKYIPESRPDKVETLRQIQAKILDAEASNDDTNVERIAIERDLMLISQVAAAARQARQAGDTTAMETLKDVEQRLAHVKQKAQARQIALNNARQRRSIYKLFQNIFLIFGPPIFLLFLFLSLSWVGRGFSRES